MWRFLPFTRISPRAKKPYINQPGFPNLYVLPYVRGRLVFAELLARAVEEEEFDLLVMDLPHFMNDARFLEFPLKFFPLVSSLIIRRDKDHFSLFPFVPNDAGCLAAYMARKKFDGFYECVDENLMSYPEGYLFQPEMSVRDDYFVFSQGLKEYFSPLWDHLDNLWREVTYFQKNYTRFRVSRVTGRLRNCLAQGGKVLFVCEYQLWWGIKKWLEEGMEEAGSATPALKEEVWDGACILEDPYLLWIKGLLDDYPAINNLFFQMLQEGRAESFDKLNVLNEIMACMASPAKSKESGNASIRSLLNFSSYLRARVVSHGRIIPHPTYHLLDSARACLGKEVARDLARLLLDYPSPVFINPQNIPAVFFQIGRDIFMMKNPTFDLPDVFHLAPYGISPSTFHQPSSLNVQEGERRYWVDQVNPYMTRQEMRKMGREMGGIRWAVEEDYRLHEIACSKAKNVVAGEANQIRVQRSWGTLGEGIHWKATLAAMARGEKAMYVKRKIHKRIQAGTFNEYTPMVFLFSEVDEKNGASTIHDSNITQRHIELGTHDFPFGKFPPPDEVYSVFLTSQKCEGLWGYHVQRESLTSISFLYNRCSLMGPMRHETINKRPKRYQCRITPQQDEELQGFPLSELGVAWAVKYAEQAVIIAAYSGWKPSSRLLVFARKRRVEVVTVPLSILSPEMVKRLRYIYFISTPLKKHPEREKIVKRFLY